MFEERRPGDGGFRGGRMKTNEMVFCDVISRFFKRASSAWSRTAKESTALLVRLKTLNFLLADKISMVTTRSSLVFPVPHGPLTNPRLLGACARYFNPANWDSVSTMPRSARRALTFIPADHLRCRTLVFCWLQEYDRFGFRQGLLYYPLVFLDRELLRSVIKSTEACVVQSVSTI